MTDKEFRTKVENLEGELGAIRDLFSQLLEKADNNAGVSLENNEVARKTLEVAQSAEDQARQAKHKAGGLGANMEGFTILARQQYEEMKLVLKEFHHEREQNRLQIEENEKLVQEAQRQVKQIASFIESLQQVGTIKMWQDVITSVNEGKKFQDKFSFAAFFFGGIIVLVGLISAILGAYEKVKSFFN